MTVKDYIPYISLDKTKTKGDRVKIQNLLRVLSIDWSSLSGENMMVIDGESGDEMEDVEVGSNGVKKTKKTKAKRKGRKLKHGGEHEVAVGSYAGDAEAMECYAEDPDDFPDDDDDVQSFYEPDFDEDVKDVDHGIEVEEIRDEGEDDEDVIDVDEEDGGVRLSKRGTLKNEARSKNHLLTRYKNPYCESCVRAKLSQDEAQKDI